MTLAAHRFIRRRRPKSLCKEGSVNANGSFKSRPAPCGRIVDGEHYEDHDDEVVVTVEVEYSCGCMSIQHEYHDGTVSRRVVHHDGHTLIDELISAE
jgi:hypothetical protein